MANNKQWIENNTDRVQKLVDKINNSHFTEVSDTTATASDVAVGKEFYNAEGIKTVGTNTLVPPITNYRELFITPEQFNHTTIDPLNSFHCFICKDKTLLAYGNRRGVTYYDEDKKDFITLLSKTYDVGNSTMTCVQYDDDRVFITSGNNGFDGVWLFNSKTKAFKQLTLEGAGSIQYNIGYFRSSDGLFFIQSSFTFDNGPYLFDPETETACLIGGDNHEGYAIQYEDENGNLFAWSTSATYGGEGIVKYNKEDNTFTKVYSEASFFNTPAICKNNTIYLSTAYRSSNYSNYAIVKCDLTNLIFTTIYTGTKYGYIGVQTLANPTYRSPRYFEMPNGDLYLTGPSSDSRIFVIKANTQELIPILEDAGAGFANFYLYKNLLFCTYIQTSMPSKDSAKGIYVINTTTYEVSRAYTQGMFWTEYKEFKGSLYVSKGRSIDPNSNNLLKFNEETLLFEPFTTFPTPSYIIKCELYEGLTDDWFIIQANGTNPYHYKYTLSTNTLSGSLVSTYYKQLIRFKDYFYFMATYTSSSVYPKRYDGETFTQVFDTYTPNYEMYEENGELFARSSSTAMPNDLKLNEETGMFELTKDKYTGTITTLKNGLLISGCNSSEYSVLSNIGYIYNPYTGIYHKLKNPAYETSNTSYTKTYNGNIVMYSYGTNKIKPTGMLIIYKE